MPCSLLTISSSDISGNINKEISGDLKKIRIDSYGKELPADTHVDVFGANNEKETEPAIQQAKDKEGCRLQGKIKVKNVAL